MKEDKLGHTSAETLALNYNDSQHICSDSADGSFPLCEACVELIALINGVRKAERERCVAHVDSMAAAMKERLVWTENHPDPDPRWGNLIDSLQDCVDERLNIAAAIRTLPSE